MPRLQDRIALVTGAGRGIGLAIAEAFVREGARVILTDIDSRAVQAEAERLGPAALALALDVREEDQWRACAAFATGRFGGLDILVNNAGITGFPETPGPHDPEHLDLGSWRAVHAVNGDGVALGCKYAILLMKHREAGSIINISSRSGVVGIARAAAYAASKAAVRNHTKTVALYCAEEGYPIRCNALLPAAILTPMWDAVLGTGPEREAVMQQMIAEVPMRCWGMPSDVAEAAVYLAGAASRYVTGAETHIDGGILAGSAAPPKPVSASD